MEEDGEPFLMRAGERLRRHAPARLPPANCQLQVIAAERETKVQKKKKKNPDKMQNSRRSLRPRRRKPKSLQCKLSVSRLLCFFFFFMQHFTILISVGGFVFFFKKILILCERIRAPPQLLLTEPENQRILLAVCVSSPAGDSGGTLLFSDVITPTEPGSRRANGRRRPAGTCTLVWPTSNYIY